MIFRIIDETPSNAPLAPSISTFYPPAPSLAFTPYKVTVKSVRSLRIIFRIIGACPANDFSRPPPSLFPFFPPWLQMIDSMRALLHSLFPPPPPPRFFTSNIIIIIIIIWFISWIYGGGGFALILCVLEEPSKMLGVLFRFLAAMTVAPHWRFSEMCHSLDTEIKTLWFSSGRRVGILLTILPDLYFCRCLIYLLDYWHLWAIVIMTLVFKLTRQWRDWRWRRVCVGGGRGNGRKWDDLRFFGMPLRNVGDAWALQGCRRFSRMPFRVGRYLFTLFLEQSIQHNRWHLLLRRSLIGVCEMLVFSKAVADWRWPNTCLSQGARWLAFSEMVTRGRMLICLCVFDTGGFGSASHFICPTLNQIILNSGQSR